MSLYAALVATYFHILDNMQEIALYKLKALYSASRGSRRMLFTEFIECAIANARNLVNADCRYRLEIESSFSGKANH